MPTDVDISWNSQYVSSYLHTFKTVSLQWIQRGKKKSDLLKIATALMTAANAPTSQYLQGIRCLWGNQEGNREQTGSQCVSCADRGSAAAAAAGALAHLLAHITENTRQHFFHFPILWDVSINRLWSLSIFGNCRKKKLCTLHRCKCAQSCFSHFAPRLWTP